MKLNRNMLTMIGITALLFAACNTTTTTAPAAIDLEKLKVDIQAMEDAFAAAEKAKDADGVAAYYSDDAISYSRNKAPQAGKAAIKAGIVSNMATDTAGNYNEYKVVDLFADGNLVVEIGSWTMRNKAGETLDNGHYMSCFQKKDGKYLCVRDMNVTSNPPKPTP